jgi:hypothetical protein
LCFETSPGPQNNNERKNTLDNMLSNYTKNKNWSKSFARAKCLLGGGGGGGIFANITGSRDLFFQKEKKIKNWKKLIFERK